VFYFVRRYDKIDEFDMPSEKSKLLLHACCGVCCAWLVRRLCQEYKTDILFFNPNIQPEEEYWRRQEAVKRSLQGLKVGFISDEYNPEPWFEQVRGLENEPEGGKRCEKCFKYRLERTAQRAKDGGYDYFASTLTTGRNKKAEVINPIGLRLAQSYGIEFLAHDWKKAGGQEQAHRVSKELGIYRQNYCGCVYSIQQSALPKSRFIGTKAG